MRSLLTVAICFLLPGCLSNPPPSRSVQAAAAPTLSIGGTKRIIRDAGEFISEGWYSRRGKRARRLSAGNGEHVAALADGLLLPDAGAMSG